MAYYLKSLPKKLGLREKLVGDCLYMYREWEEVRGARNPDDSAASEIGSEQLRERGKKLFLDGLRRAVSVVAHASDVEREMNALDVLRARINTPKVQPDGVLDSLMRFTEDVDFVCPMAVGRPLEVIVIRFKKKQRLVDEVIHGLPAPMWALEVNREVEAGWIVSRQVKDINPRRVKGKLKSGVPRNGDRELQIIARLEAVLGGRRVDTARSPIHPAAKLFLMNLSDGWPHILQRVC